jgi:tetratricopeptide (TPR) repeat protein
MKTVNLSAKLIVFLFSISFIGNSQDLSEAKLKEVLELGSEKEVLEMNTSLMLNESNYHAFLTAEKLLTFNPQSANYNYRIGYALLSISDDFTKTIPYLEKAVSSTTKRFEMVSTREKDAPLEALFYMGRAYHLAGEVDKAIKYYEDFIKVTNVKNANFKNAVLGIKQCNIAKDLVKLPKNFKVKNIGSTINTNNPEYSPVISIDGTALYFTSRRLLEDSSNKNFKEPGTNLYLEDIFVSYKNESDEWSKPKVLEFCKPEYNEATVAVSGDERRIFAYIDQTGNGDLYTSTLKSNLYQDLEILEDNGINTDAWETHMSESPDGMRKYFVSDREGGYGGRDIYMIKKIGENLWSDPENLGPTINTEYDEDSPFISIDNKTMYFSHNGDKSMGGFDIFKSKRDNKGSWSTPENLGYPLNTTSDEIYYTSIFDGTVGYFSSYRPKGFGEKDIYQVINENERIEGVGVFFGEVTNNNGSAISEDISLNLKCLDCETPYEFSVYPKLSNGTFLTSLTSCHEYELTLSRNNGETEISKEIIKTHCEDVSEEIFRSFILDSLTQNLVDPRSLLEAYDPISIKHYFGYNKNVLDPAKGALKVFLDSLNKQIEIGRTTMEIRINASASKVPTQSYKNNAELAEKRANSVKEFLTNYFEEIGLTSSITINVNNIIVDGPEYDADYKNLDKYLPFQFVEVSLAGFNSFKGMRPKSIFVTKLVENEDGTSTLHKYIDQQGDLFTSGEMIEGDYDFHIVIGVFQNSDFAKNLSSKAKEKGFDAEIIEKQTGLYIVTAGKSPLREDAIRILNEAREEVIQSAWILNIKN